MSYALGVDINSRYSQISVYMSGDKGPVPVSAVMGQDFYEIPTMVAYVESQNRWCYGYEAYSLSEASAAIPVDNLLRRAEANEVVRIHGEEYPVVDLLELYIKKVLGMTNLNAPYHLADVIVFSAELLNHDSISFLNSMIKRIGIDSSKIFLLSHSECIHHYMIHQNRELWSQDVLVLDYSGEELLGKIYKVRRNTRPVVCETEEYSYPIELMNSDQELLPVIEKITEGKIISSVYLIGDSSLEECCPKSISMLCSKRRAFMGRNMYTRGACYAAMEYAQLSNDSAGFIYLGADKLKCNVGAYIKAENGGETFAELIEAGLNWYDVGFSKRFFVDTSKDIRLVLKPIDGSQERDVIIRLNDFPKRPPHCTQIRLLLYMDKPQELSVEIKDIGFGEIFPSSDLSIKEIVSMEDL